MDISIIRSSIARSAQVKELMLKDDGLLAALAKMAAKTVQAYRDDRTFFAFGNGGSSSDAQHIVAELVGRFNYDRPPLRAQALSANVANLTCIGNDYGYDQIFARQIQGAGRRGDIMLAITTSGKSPNVLKAIQMGREIGMQIFGLTSVKGQAMAEICDECLCVPSSETPRIQEAHILLGHILCELVEAELFPRNI